MYRYIAIAPWENYRGQHEVPINPVECLISIELRIFMDSSDYKQEILYIVRQIQTKPMDEFLGMGRL